ncbi:MAG TPA: PASTA domain-containing protein, partial [Terriglobales bacterium]|nr:PASTA domain-containing protein [Terriglobales bacterium]
ASFGGFAPINDPAVAILVVIDSPRGGHEGGATAGPVFKAIAERVLPYLGVPHDIPVEAQPAPLHIAAADAHEESEEVAELPLAAPAAAPVVPASMVVLHYGANGGVVVPDFTGQSVRTVSASCERLGLDLALQGSGVARAQAPAAGTRLALGGRVMVRFAATKP